MLAPACQSATVDVRRLPDEFVGLPTGFLVSAVATFVGTLWPAGAEFTQFAAGSQALQEGARTPLAFAARYPSVRPHAAPPAWAPHVLIGTGGPPARSVAGRGKERRSE